MWLERQHEREEQARLSDGSEGSEGGGGGGGGSPNPGDGDPAPPDLGGTPPPPDVIPDPPGGDPEPTKPSPHLGQDGDYGISQDDPIASCLRDSCLVSGYEEMRRMTDNYRTDWGNIEWGFTLPIDFLVEALTKRPMPTTGLRFGTQVGYPTYEFEKGFIEYQSKIVDGVVTEKYYVGNPIWTGVKEYGSIDQDDTLRTRTVTELCFLGSCI